MSCMLDAHYALLLCTSRPRVVSRPYTGRECAPCAARRQSGSLFRHAPVCRPFDHEPFATLAHNDVPSTGDVAKLIPALLPFFVPYRRSLLVALYTNTTLSLRYYLLSTPTRTCNLSPDPAPLFDWTQMRSPLPLPRLRPGVHILFFSETEGLLAYSCCAAFPFAAIAWRVCRLHPRRLQGRESILLSRASARPATIGARDPGPGLYMIPRRLLRQQHRSCSLAVLAERICSELRACLTTSDVRLVRMCARRVSVFNALLPISRVRYAYDPLSLGVYGRCPHDVRSCGMSDPILASPFTRVLGALRFIDGQAGLERTHARNPYHVLSPADGVASAFSTLSIRFRGSLRSAAWENVYMYS
ncbi:hypothetical protein B0H14DRAFT_3743584 [Mycena olivaceomarginata]|nr:hypothetical protein B0H14DRAFT_3743584 [Mycena olivaceomarginata]